MDEGTQQPAPRKIELTEYYNYMVHGIKLITSRNLSTAGLAGAPGLLPPGRGDQHGQVHQHREPRGHRLQDHRGPRLGERDDGALL